MGGLLGNIFGAQATPAPATVINPYTAGTAQNATAATQGAVGQQQLTAQQQQDFLNQLQGQQGLANQTAAGQNLASTYGQLQGVANGTGPNPAQAQLAQATGANTANQAALMAGQRGAGANAGLIARQAAMQGGANQQNAAGQAATLQAQQSLGALGQLSGIAGQQAGLGGQQLGQQQTGLSNLATQQAGITGANQAQQNAQLGALQGVNNANVTNTGQQIQANTAQAQLGGGAIGGLLNGAGVAAGYLAEGGEVKPTTIPRSTGPTSFLGKHNHPEFTHDHTTMASGGKVPAMVSPGEIYLPKKEAHAVADGKANPMKSGHKIPGHAKVPGNSIKNDTVPMTLEEGGCVIPRSVLEGKNPHEAAARFVAAHISKSKAKK